MLIKDIEPIRGMGKKIVGQVEQTKLIENLVEIPLRRPCEVFAEKGIETVMSSANKENVLPRGVKRTEKKDVYGEGQQWSRSRPTYKLAGKGYAWIMINFDTLSDENKELLFKMERRVDERGRDIGSRAIWFVVPTEINRIRFGRQISTEPKLEEFEKRHIVLEYNAELYPRRTVFLRYPINERTTAKDVETYFTKFAMRFKSQVVKKEEQDEMQQE